MTEVDRDEIDREANKHLQECEAGVKTLSNLIDNITGTLNSNIQEHLRGVLVVLYYKLEYVSLIFAKQKKMRYEKALKQANESYHNVKSTITYNNMPQQTIEVNGQLKVDTVIEELHLDESQMKILEQENKILLNELESMIDQARQIEQQVAEISLLQEFFAQKVAEQAEAIEQIKKQTVHGTLNVEKGNKEIEKATKRGWNLTQIVTVMLFILSFMLLFLHWFQ